MAEIVGPDGRALALPSETGALRDELREAREDVRVAERRAEQFAYAILQGLPSNDQDLPQRERLKLVRQARDIWKRDPQAGAAVRLRNDFVFGRGVPKPKCHDPGVQEMVDEAWDDPQNKRTLTSVDAQREKGIDLSLQSNVLFLLFPSEKGGDGKVKLGLLNHDWVEDVVRDEENRHRILYYKTSEIREKWDWERDMRVRDGTQAEVKYYAHWSNVDEAKAEGGTVPTPPDNKKGVGLVYHVAVNKTSEMAFGYPEMQRVIEWFAAFKEFMASRVDLTKAAAQFIMKRKVAGGEARIVALAQKQLTQRGELGGTLAAGEPVPPARPGSILNENPGLSHEPFNLQTNSASAQADGDMLRSQVSAGTGFPAHYFGGDPGSLAGATALELPVLKLVEATQEVFEQVFRWFIDRVIETGVSSGRIAEELDPSEIQAARVRRIERRADALAASTAPVADETLLEYRHRLRDLAEAHADAVADEEMTQRDLSYEFSMPNPLRRAMTDLVTSIATIARTFDPNGTNIELSRILLGVSLGDALEMEDPQELVEKIFPEGYEDPALAAFNQPPPGQAPAPAQQPTDPNQPTDPQGAVGADGKTHQQDNAYGAKRQATTPEQAAKKTQESATPRFDDLPPEDRALVLSGWRNAERMFGNDVWEMLDRELADGPATSEPATNGH